MLHDLPHHFIVPREVVEELERGLLSGHAVVELSGVTIIDLMGSVEAAVIQLALTKGIATVCLDEKKGRRIARAVDLEVVGTLGLLLEAKKLGMLNAISPVIERLLEYGIWYDRGLLESVLSSAGESIPSAVRLRDRPPRG